MLRLPRPSIEWRLPLVVVTLLIVVVVTLTVTSYREVHQLSGAIADARLGRAAVELSTLLAAPLETQVRQTVLAADHPVFARRLQGNRALDPQTAAALTALVDSVGGGTVVAGLWRADGSVVLTVPETADPRWAGAPLPRPPHAGVGPFHAVHDSMLYYDIAAEVRGGDSILGHVVQRRRVASNSQSVAAVRGLIGDESVLLVGSRETGVWTDLLTRAVAPPVGRSDTAALLHFAIGGRGYLAHSDPVPSSPWTLVVALPRDPFFAPARGFLRSVLVIAGGLLLLGGGLAWLASRRITRPIRALAEAADGVARGQYDRRVAVRDRDELGRLAEAFNTMTERIAAQVRALRTGEARFRSFVKATAQIVWTTDAEGNVRGSLPEWQAYTGQRDADLQGAGWTTAIHPDDARRALAVRAEAMPARRPYETEFRIRRHDGVYRWFAVRGVPVPAEDGGVREWVGTAEDITERQETSALLARREEELRQAQKMEAVGRLAGGIAHDFNNLLTTILGPADLALQELPSDHPVRPELEEIRSAAIRATEVTRQLLAFSRQQVTAAEPLDLNDVVEDATRFLQRVIGEQIDLERSLAPDLGTIRADRTQLEQVIMNLAVNARDAMPSGGKLTIETANADLDAESAEAHPGLAPGPYVLLAVTDTGSGMSPETRERVFEPFFTTKERGKGTGLGMATVYGIAQQNGGHILVYSEPGEGTTFKLYFPRVDEAAVAQPSQDTRDLSAYRGTETVLIAEDDATVRHVTDRVLRMLGYVVVAEEDGAAALERIRTGPGPIHLVVADVVMPVMTGGELVKQLAEERPDLPVLLLSGYAGDAVVRHGKVPAGVPFLQKPFTPEGLARRVHEILNATASVPTTS